MDDDSSSDTLHKKINSARLKQKMQKPEEKNKQQLVEEVKKLQAHITQLKNLLKKRQTDTTVIKHAENKLPARKLDFAKFPKRHVALKLAYFGWDYNGFASQEDSPNTIEDVLFESLTRTQLIESRECANYHRCGRTDKGVSGTCQVISIDLRSKITKPSSSYSKDNFVKGENEKVGEECLGYQNEILNEGQKNVKIDGNYEITKYDDGDCSNYEDGTKDELPYCHILNRILPPNIRVLSWAPVSKSFSARFDCLMRTYKYWFPKGNLNLLKMQEGAKYLIGKHDFRNFCKMDVGNGVVKFERSVEAISIDQLTAGVSGYEMCEFKIVSKAFLWHQIRCIVAVLLMIGHEQEEPQLIKELLNVEKNPCKPQYSMASEIPLNLFATEFENVKWIWSKDWHSYNIEKLQQLWANHAIKSTMIRNLLHDLEEIPMDDGEMVKVKTQANILQVGQNKRHLPLLKRQKCESLSERIRQVTKRKKLDENP